VKHRHLAGVPPALQFNLFLQAAPFLKLAVDKDLSFHGLQLGAGCCLAFVFFAQPRMPARCAIPQAEKPLAEAIGALSGLRDLPFVLHRFQIAASGAVAFHHREAFAFQLFRRT
jgi:hypothetical protein